MKHCKCKIYNSKLLPAKFLWKTNGCGYEPKLIPDDDDDNDNDDDDNIFLGASVLQLLHCQNSNLKAPCSTPSSLPQIVKSTSFSIICFSDNWVQDLQSYQLKYFDRTIR